MEITLTTIGWNLVALLAMMFIGWLISLMFKNVTIVDTLWGLGFVLVACITFSFGEGYPVRKGLIAVPVTLWGLRLAVHLAWRNWGAGEDLRFNQYGDNANSYQNKSENHLCLLFTFPVSPPRR